MNNIRKVTRIDKPIIKWHLNVAVYCRVSTPHPEQIESLSNQVEYYKQMVSKHIDWILVDVYTDIKSGNNISKRPGFQRMLSDCVNKKIDLIITKSISRFGRNAEDVLAVINKLRVLNVDLFFEVENIRISETSKTFLLSIIEAVAQAESESRRQNINWGIKYGLKTGKSKLYNRKCFGYSHDSKENIIINEEEAKIVQKIFSLYVNGYSIIGIIRELNKEGIKSPTGKEIWPKRTIDTILSNEKYMGNAVVGKTYTKDYKKNERRINKGEQDKFQAANTHPPLISKEQFEQVQKEKLRRSNIHKNVDGSISRTTTHYSMKSDSDNNILL